MREKSQNAFSYTALPTEAADRRCHVFAGHMGMISSQGTTKVMWKPVKGDVSAPNQRLLLAREFSFLLIFTPLIAEQYTD